MSDVDSRLVKAIAEQVMAALRGGGGLSSPVEVHAPVGQCTGDYSKFAQKIEGAPAPAEFRPVGPQATATQGDGPSGQGGAQASAAVVVTAMKGVITVSHLKGVRGVVRLAKGAMLTPLAQDYVRERGISVMSDESAAVVAVNAGGPAAAGGAPIFWWIEGSCPSVAKVVEALRPSLLASRERNSGDNLKNVVKEAAFLVKTKKAAGAILFVANSARAVCYANRCASLRAMVGTSDKAVEEGIEQLGANVLVIEYPVLGFKGMMGLVKPFVEAGSSQHAAPAAVQRELDELRNCG